MLCHASILNIYPRDRLYFRQNEPNLLKTASALDSCSCANLLIPIRISLDRFNFHSQQPPHWSILSAACCLNTSRSFVSASTCWASDRSIPGTSERCTSKSILFAACRASSGVVSVVISAPFPLLRNLRCAVVANRRHQRHQPFTTLHFRTIPLIAQLLWILPLAAAPAFLLT